jgi:YD repeat-containing protein
VAHFWKAAVLVGLGATTACGTSEKADDSGHAAAGMPDSGAPGETGGSHAQATGGTGAATGGNAGGSAGTNPLSGGTAGTGATSPLSQAGGEAEGPLAGTGGAAGDPENTGGRAHATGGNATGGSTSGRAGQGGDPEKTGGAAGSGNSDPGTGGGGASGGNGAGGQGGQAHAGANCDAPGPCTYTATYGAATPTVTTYSYDADGTLVREDEDDNQDGVTEVSVAYSYDDAGRLIEKKATPCEVSSLAIYICKTWITYSYDEQGRPLVEYEHVSPAGKNPACLSHTYDERGLLVKTEHIEWCETNVVEVETYEYDAAERLVRKRLGYGANPESWSYTYVYEYGDNGVSRETITDWDGSVDVFVYTRNAAGQVLIEDRDYEVEDDRQIIYTYDQNGNELTSMVVYQEGDSAGVERGCWVSTYDDCGHRLTEWNSDACQEGAANQDITWSWSYACFEE